MGVRRLGRAASASALPSSAPSGGRAGSRSGAPVGNAPLTISGQTILRGGTPFQIRGSSTWCLVQLDDTDMDAVLDNTAAKKFNSIVVMSALSATANAQYGPPQALGLSPFTDSKLTPNESYWQRVDRIIRQAGKRGLVVQMAHLYAGHPSSADGFASRIAGCTTGECTTFGQWLGARYLADPNLIWIAGGDDMPETDQNKWDALNTGITSVDSTHLFSGHPSRGEEGKLFGSYITLNSAYRNRFEVASGTLAAYQGSPTNAVLGFEYVYEGDGTPWSNPTLTASEARRQSWQALLSGAAGANFGNHEVWTCGYVGGSNLYPNWKTSTTGLNSPGHFAHYHLADFFDRIAWSTLIPDATSTFVTAGRSSAENYVAAAFTPQVGVAIIPAGGQITVDMGEFSSPLRANYFDPTSGAWTLISGSLSNSGSQNFDPPLNAAGDTDMVLLLEAV